MIALVTGANRGLGLEVVSILSKDAQYKQIYLAARSLASAQETAAELSKASGVRSTIIPLELDVANAASVSAAAATVKANGHTLAVLVQNAGTMTMDALSHATATSTFNVNLRGVVTVWHAFKGLLTPDATVVHVSSGLGELTSAYSKEVKEYILSLQSEQEVLAAADTYIALTKDGAAKVKAQGWNDSSYGTSKALLNALTRVLAKENPKLRVVSVCPGWCKTRMGGESAMRSSEQGGKSIVQSIGVASGTFSRDGQILAW